MENSVDKVQRCALTNNEEEITELLNTGLDPNLEDGWLLRLAARHGSYGVVRILIQYGANPHLVGEAGASSLQLAVFSNVHWDSDKWSFLLSCYDSSQLADGAAVAIIFRNLDALKKILQTGRCNTRIPTTLTGKTVEQLAKGYKLQHLLSTMTTQNESNINDNGTTSTPHNIQSNFFNVASVRSPLTSSACQNELSPSVARFFHQTASQSALTPPRPTNIVQISTHSRT